MSNKLLSGGWLSDIINPDLLFVRLADLQGRAVGKKLREKTTDSFYEEELLNGL